MNYFAKLISVVCLALLLAAVTLRAGEIHKAAAAGDLKKVRALIEADSTLLESKNNDGIENNGDTPLITACKAFQVAVANFIIDKGANVNAKGFLSGTPLLWTRMGKVESFDLVQRLIAKGADVNAENEYNWTPLCKAAIQGNLKIAKLLIDHGANLNFRWQGSTILQMVIVFKYESNGEMAKLLLENGAKLQDYSFGNTELHLAALSGLADIVQILVKHGGDVNAVNDFNHTALYYAAKHGYRKAADALIAAGANKSAIVETNYGKASQLTATLKEGEAYLWFLGGLSPSTGYAVKTKSHLLIFDPSGIDESPEAGLTNGYLNPNELAGQKITILFTRPTINGPSVSELAKKMLYADFVLNFKPTADSVVNKDIPPYHLATPNESFSMGGIQVHTIQAMSKSYIEKINGLGYLVEADGVKIFHSGLHASRNDSTQMEKYRKEIDFLKPFGPIDIVILPIEGHHISVAYEPYLYLLDQLSPKVIFLDGDDRATEEPEKCIKVLRTRNIPVAYPEGGIAMGDRFHYLRDGTQK